CAYLLFGPPYDELATEARGRGWIVQQLPGGHLHQLVDPDGVARSLLAIGDQMGITDARPGPRWSLPAVPWAPPSQRTSPVITARGLRLSLVRSHRGPRWGRAPPETTDNSGQRPATRPARQRR